jgi:hypothetical protein
LRHIRSILYSLVLAPAAWVLTAVGLTGDLTARGRDGFAVENFTGLLLLLLAGAAYGILVLGPFSPAGPLLAGVVYLALSAWALTSPSAYADVWPPAVAKDGFDLSRPGYGLAAILAVPLICTALSARRWAKYEPPVLPLIGPIGRAEGAAPAHGTPLSIAQTTVIGAGRGTADLEPTTVLRLPSAGSTPATVSGPVMDEDPTIAWAVPKVLAAVAASDEDTVASPRPPQPAEEPPTVVEVSVGEPTVTTLDEEPTTAVADAEPAVADDVIEAVADEEPTTIVAAEEPAAIAAEEPAAIVAAEEPTEVVDEEEPKAIVPQSSDDEVAEVELVKDDEITEPAGTADEPEPARTADEPESAVTADEPEDGEVPADEADAATPVAGADRTEVIRLPAADNGDKTQVVRLPVADNGERTQVVRLPMAEVVPFPAVDPEEKTQFIRLPQVLRLPVRSTEAEPGQRTRDLSNRATGDVGGDETQVIRLAGKTVDDEKTQVIRPALVTRPDELGDVLAFRAPALRDATPPPPPAEPEPSVPAAAAPKPAANPKAPASIADAEAPNFADDPTSPLALSSLSGDEAAEARSSSMTVMNMERPPDDPADETIHIEILTQRRPNNEE